MNPPCSRQLAAACCCAIPGLAWAALIAAVAFAAMAPTLCWVEFSYNVERLNVASALEMRRGGTWLIPTLEGEPRVRKPPLMAWITAWAIRPQTVADLGSLDAAVRNHAARRLAFQARWPALAMACLMLLAVYHLGRTLVDPLTGVIAALVAATTAYFAWFARQAITDIPLMLFVSIANAMLAVALIDGRRMGLILAGLSMGLGMMSKGPVIFTQTLVPALLFVLWRTIRRDHGLPPEPDGGVQRPSWAAALLLAVALMLAVGGAWFLFVALRTPDVGGLWLKEVLRTDPVEKATSHWWSYLNLFPHLLPWTVFFIGGLIIAVRAIAGERSWGRRVLGADEHRCNRIRDGLVYALLLIVVPILIMSFFRDRKERYLLPLVAPCAVLVAASLREFLVMTRFGILERTGLWAHWTLITVPAIGLPIAGACAWNDSFATIDGRPWFTPALAGSTLFAAVAILIVGLLLHRRRRGSLIGVTAILMLAGQALLIHGHAQSRQGHSEFRPLAERIWRDHPTAVCYNLRGPDGRRKMAPPDLSIYLNRITPVYDTVDQIPPPTDRPQIYIELWEKNAPEPQPAPGWEFYARTPRNPREWWVAFLRQPP